VKNLQSTWELRLGPGDYAIEISSPALSASCCQSQRSIRRRAHHSTLSHNQRLQSQGPPSMPYVKHCTVSTWVSGEPKVWVLDGINNVRFSGGPVVAGARPPCRAKDTLPE
jgi:hypothetical protein